MPRSLETAPAVRDTAAVVLIATITAIVFANTLHNGFHLDDFYRILDNPEIRRVTPVWRHFTDPATISGNRGISETRLHQLAQYRPLLPLSLSFNYALGEYRVTGYHVGNILLHVAASILVYLLVLEALRQAVSTGGSAESRRRTLALLVSLAFAVHPVAGIPVNYILARDLLMMQAFLVGSLLTYLRMRRRGWSPSGWVATLGLLALALMSKSTAAVAPLLVLAYEITIGRLGIRSVAAWRRAVPSTAIVLGFYAATALGLDFASLARIQEGGGGIGDYALTQARVHVGHYLANFFWPFPIRMGAWVAPAQGPWEIGVLVGLATIGLTLGLAWRFRGAAPVLAFAVLAYWILMLPESSFVPLHHPAVHYRPYPSSPFLFLALGVAAERVLRPRFALLMGCAAIGYFAIASVHLNRNWRTEETLWSQSVRHGAEPLAHMNLAMSIPDRRDPRVRHHLEEAVLRSPNYILAHINLGLLDLEEDRASEALERIEWTVRLDPSQAESHYWLAMAYSRTGSVGRASAASAEAARLDPRNPRYLYKAGLDTSTSGDHAAALDYARRIEEIDPDYAEAGFLAAFSLHMLGRLDEAIDGYIDFLERNPDHAQVLFNLGHAFMSSRDCRAAIPPFRRSLELEPDRAAAHAHLSSCYSEIGQGRLAELHRSLAGG